MLRTWLLVLISLGLSGLSAQYTETELKVYTFNDGLSHRNVFDLLQDSSGLLWLGTMDGLNRFDGYGFRDYKQLPAFEGTDLVKFLRLSPNGQQLFAAAPNFLMVGDLMRGSWMRYSLKKGPIQRRQNLVPTAMEVVPTGEIYLVLQDETNGQLGLYRFRPGMDETPLLLKALGGQYTKRPFARDKDHLYFGALENELWTLNASQGNATATYRFPPNTQGRKARIADLQCQNNQLWVLMDDGRLFFRQQADDGDFQAFLPAAPGLGNQSMQSLYVGQDGSLVVGGFGRLLLYDPWTKNWEDLDAPIRQLTRNTCTYRDILLDLSGVLWVASDFGAIRITRSDHLFTQYLSGGSEYCSNVYCSTRGLAEDEKGLIYISYYNSIHVLDPNTNDIRPLFPANDYFNYPYGLVYHQQHLYTGDGHSIRLSDLQRRTIFPDVGESEGVVALSPDSLIWFSHDRQLLIYDPATDSLRLYRNSEGKSWANISGAEISFLLPQEQSIFIGSKNDGLYHLDLTTNRLTHWNVDSSRFSLCSNRINALYLYPGQQQSKEKWRNWRQLKPSLSPSEPDFAPCEQYDFNYTDPHLFLGTANGLQAINLRSGALSSINEAQGLPNNFINGILPEGDSVLWISTDYGLCRYGLQNGRCTNFFTSDGLSADEFNRISFHRASNGRLYFGGLNGINAFTPDKRLLEQRQKRTEVPLLLTQIDYIDGYTDSLKSIPLADISQGESLTFKHSDRLFLFTFSLADYRFPSQNRYSYFLEGYDKGWSAASTDYRLRLNDLPPGEYTLHLRARVGNEDWLGRQLSLPIYIQQPYYYSWWFWASLAALVLLGAFSMLRYRVYTMEKKRRELEELVEERTAELQKEQEKSEALLLNILPAQTARELKENGKATARRYEEVTVFFSDFVAFTAIANAIDATLLVEELDYCFRTFDEIVARYGLEKIKTIGDAYLFVGGLEQDGASAAIASIRAARDIQRFLKQHAEAAERNGKPVFRARVGLHTGALVTGVVGTHKFAYDIWGETVNIAARMESFGLPGAIIISERTKQLVGSAFACTPHGTYEEHGRSLDMWLVE